MSSPESVDPREWRQMRNDVDDGYELLKRVQESITKVSARQHVHGNRLEEIQQTLDIHSGRLDRMEDNQRRQGERLGRVEGRLEGVEGRLEGVEGRLEGVEGRLEGVEGRLEGVEGRLEGVDGRLEGVDGRLVRIEEAQGQQGERLGRIEDTQQQILDLLRGRTG